MRHIALMTDFGMRDHYVAAMKGVIAARCDAMIDDLSHELAPFDVFEAAWFLHGAARYWPAGTVFVVVIDPGVGTTRRMLAVDDGARIFLAPDNGVLHFIEGDARSIENASLFLPDGSTTFHGRDRFAPVAAAIASGLPLDELGPRVDDRVRLDYTPPKYESDRATGCIVDVDRFGNCLTDIEHARLGFEPHLLRACGASITRSSRNYAEAGSGPFMIVGSSGCYEISVTNESAAELLQLGRFDVVTIQS
jgi:S-adenosylmethionine hydrolase